jgi:hypothetical protein
MVRALGCLALILVLVSGCGGSGENGNSDRSSPQQNAEPKTAKAATAIAEEQALRYSSGDFAGAWEMWTDEAKEIFSREDYVTLGETCAGTGVPLEVDPARLEGADEAVVRAGLGDIKTSHKLKYDDGHWKWEPAPDDIKIYELGLQGAIKARKAEDSCEAD